MGRPRDGQGGEVQRLMDARKAFWDALCDAQSKLTADLEPVVCECGSRRLVAETTAPRLQAIVRRRSCMDCGRVVLTAEFVIARRASSGKRRVVSAKV